MKGKGKEILPYDKNLAIERVNNSLDSSKQLLPKYIAKNSVTNETFKQTNKKLIEFKSEIKKRQVWNKKYSSLEELQTAIDDFFIFVLENEMYPTIELLSIWLDMDRQTLNRIENDHRDFRCDTIKRAKEMIMSYFTQHLLAKSGNPAGNIFHLKALFGLTETSNLVVNPPSNWIDDPTRPKNEQEILDALPDCPTSFYDSNHGII
ncbi:MAG: hypothetical protein HFJ41_02360 [Clostridia bacterium]|jgi:hypothetical protein|nr:hypothetical protein [Clostridia bacterium]